MEADCCERIVNVAKIKSVNDGDDAGADDYHDDGGGLIFDEEHVGDDEDAINVMRGFS